MHLMSKGRAKDGTEFREKSMNFWSKVFASSDAAPTDPKAYVISSQVVESKVLILPRSSFQVSTPISLDSLVIGYADSP